MPQQKTTLKKMPVKKALNLLIDTLDDTNRFFQLLSRWTNNENDRRDGVIEPGDYTRFKNQITNALYEYIDELSDENLKKIFSQSPAKDSKSGDATDSDTVHVEGDGNTVISGVSNSQITIIQNSKNVNTGNISAGGDVRIGDGD